MIVLKENWIIATLLLDNPKYDTFEEIYILYIKTEVCAARMSLKFLRKEEIEHSFIRRGYSQVA